MSGTVRKNKSKQPLPLPALVKNYIDYLVDIGLFMNRNEAIRFLIYYALVRIAPYVKHMKKASEEINELLFQEQ